MLFQRDAMGCGSTCLATVAEYYGCKQDSNYLRERFDFGKTGISLLGISKAAEKIGFKTVLPFGRYDLYGRFFYSLITF